VDNERAVAADDRVVPVVAGRRVAGVAAPPQTGEALAEVVAPRPLEQITGHRRDVADLRAGDDGRRLRQHAIALLDLRVGGDASDARAGAQVQAVLAPLHALEVGDAADVDQHLGRLDAVLHPA
jgi:hypothetical protein